MVKTVFDRSAFDIDTSTLYGSQCAECRRIHFPPKDGCPDCYSLQAERVALPTSGHIHALTRVHIAPPGFVPPYVIASVDLPAGVRILGQVILDEDQDLGHGARVMIRAAPVRRDSDDEAIIGYVFVPE